jgi:hypothetical protein
LFEDGADRGGIGFAYKEHAGSTSRGQRAAMRFYVSANQISTTLGGFAGWRSERTRFGGRRRRGNFWLLASVCAPRPPWHSGAGSDLAKDRYRFAFERYIPNVTKQLAMPIQFRFFLRHFARLVPGTCSSACHRLAP